MNNKVIKRYLRQVRRHLACTCTRAMRGAVLAALRARIEDAYGAAEALTLDTLYTRFGTPAEIAKSCHTTEDAVAAYKRMRLARIVAVGVCVLAMLVVGFFIYLETLPDNYTVISPPM